MDMARSQNKNDDFGLIESLWSLRVKREETFVEFKYQNMGRAAVKTLHQGRRLGGHHGQS